jgi:hypothetical protein
MSTKKCGACGEPVPGDASKVDYVRTDGPVVMGSHAFHICARCVRLEPQALVRGLRRSFNARMN